MARNARSEYSWERQPGESAKAFEAFELYCKMGEERSTRTVAQKCSKSVSLIQRWSCKWNWVDRARDYDNEMRRKSLRAEKAAYQKMKKRHIGMAVQLQQKAFDALKNLNPEKLSAKEIREFMKLGTELERMNMALAEQEETREVSDEVSVDIYLPEKDGDNGGQDN